MNLTNMFNPYYWIGAAIVFASIGGTIYIQSRQIHHYHVAYDTDEKTIAILQNTLAQEKIVQDTQTKTTEANVKSVITAPGKTQTIIKTVYDAPEPANCVTPILSDEVKNAF